MAQVNGIGQDDPNEEVIGCSDPSAINYVFNVTKSCGPVGTYTSGNCNSGAPPNAICSGCCYKIISDGDTGGDEEFDPDLDEINSDFLFNCPDISTIQINLNNTITDANGVGLTEECCKRDYLGFDVSYTFVEGKSLCMVVKEEPCPPFETLQLGPDQVTIVNIKSENCCTEEIVGPPVYWDGKSCKLLPTTDDCLFNEIFLVQLKVDPKVEQVFGINDANEQIPLSIDCCTEDVAGFDVTWNTDAKRCEKTQPEQDSTTITLNEEIITANDCDDLLVSTKLYFTKPTEECLADITALLLPDNGAIIVEQLGIFDSETDGFNTWVDLGVRLTNTTNNPFNINLFINGVLDCCEYDIRVDNIRVDCFKEEDRIFYSQSKCVGFDLTRVIDNKKSWVYNPGSFTGVTLEDVNIVKRGEENLIQGFGVINRTFAPSVDADLPWRYTDYYEQSNILEPHSKLVMNSKEMELTFNMCNECCVSFSECPEGYTLSAGTKSCYKSSCPAGYTLSGASLCYSASTEVPTFIMSGFTTQGAVPPQDLIDDNVALNPVPFNSFLTAGISTGSTVNIPLSGISYTIANIIDYRSLDLNSPPAISPTFDFFGVYYEIYTTPPETLYTGSTILTKESGSYCIETVSLLQLEEYKKVFQSFWVRMIEQFVPATTIFVSGEKWCNNDKFICTEIEECDYDYEYVDSDITVIEYGTDFPPSSGTTNNETNGGDTNTGNNSETEIDNEAEGTPNNSDDGAIVTGPIKVITTPSEPNGNTTTTETRTSNDRNIKRQKAQYYGGLIKGRNEIIFK